MRTFFSLTETKMRKTMKRGTNNLKINFYECLLKINDVLKPQKIHI